MLKRTVVLTGLLVLVVSACQGSVADPVGDADEVDHANVDIVEAGVDYRTATTRLWLRFAPGVGPAEQSSWELSLDGDTAAELRASIGTAYGAGSASDPDRFVVQNVTSLEELCRYYVGDRGFDGQDTVSVSFDSRCIRIGPELAPSVRIRGISRSGRYSGDVSEWTAAVPRS